MTGFDNSILIAYGMCPPIDLMEYYQTDPEKAPATLNEMRRTATEVWGDDDFETMQRGSTAVWNWDDDT